MAVTMDNIISQIGASFARPSLFRVEIGPSDKLIAGSRELSLNCYNALIPGLSIATTDKDIGFRSVAYQKLYDDVLLSFYCSEDLSELEYMQDWMKIISNPDTNRIGYYDDYVATIQIIHLSKEEGSLGNVEGFSEIKDNKKTLTTTLFEAYPKKIDPIQLDYASNDIMRLTVSFTYRYYTQTWGNKESSSDGTETTTSRNRIEPGLRSGINSITHGLTSVEQRDFQNKQKSQGRPLSRLV